MSGEHADMFLGLGGERIHGFTWGLRGFADSTLLFGMEGWRSWAFSEFCLVALSLNPEDDMMRAPVGGILGWLAQAICCGILW